MREKIQTEATKAIVDNKYVGIVEVAARVGKTKLVIDALNNVTKDINVLVLAPKKEIFKGWKAEIIKWKLNDNININYVWSNSLKKDKDMHHLIICDEIHDYNQKVLAELRLRQMQGSRILGLTGTLDDFSKFHIENTLSLTPIYTYTMEQAIKDKIVADYKIVCIGCELDDEDKYVMAGTKERPFLQTEKQAYAYWDAQYDKAKSLSRYSSLKFLMSKRKDVIYNSKTKLLATKKLLKDIDRCIIFTGLTKIADNIGDSSYHSKSDKSALEDFKDLKIDKLAVVSMVSMGVTIPKLKIGVFNQLKSSETLAVQQSMRCMNLEGDEIAELYIVYLKNTRDKIWVESALNGFDKKKIEWR